MSAEMADAVSDRIAKNNDTFREANEQIRERASHYAVEMERIPFLCECPVPTCVQIVHLTPAEYEAVRADAGHYMTAVGHEAAERPVGQVIARNDRYVVVEK
jgi:hypothetical protein